MAELPVRVGSQTKWISGLTEKTTCNDIMTGVLLSTGQLACARDQVHTHYALVEVWRGVSKVLSPAACILRLWTAWAGEQPAVSFAVKRLRRPRSGGEVTEPGLEEMRVAVREAEEAAARPREPGRVPPATSGRRKVARRSSSAASRRPRGPDTLHPRGTEELRAAIQARMRVMMAQKESIEAELAKLQLEQEARPPPRPGPKPRLGSKLPDTSQDSGVDSGAVTDDGELQRGAVSQHSYDYINTVVGLRPPPENLEEVLCSVERVERLNGRLERTEEDIVALRFELAMLTEPGGGRVASPLDCFNTEVTRYRDINARLLEEITENRGRLQRAGERHEIKQKMVRRVEFDMNFVEREGRLLEEGLGRLEALETQLEEEEEEAGQPELEIDFDCLEEELILTDLGLAESDHLIEPTACGPAAGLAASTLV